MLPRRLRRSPARLLQLRRLLGQRQGLQRAVIPAPPTTTKEVLGGKGGLESKEIAPVPPPSNEWGVWVRGFGTGMKISNDASRIFNQDVGGFQMGGDRRFGSVL